MTQGMLGLMTILTSIILPKKMGPEGYGYYQEFAFYLSLINVLGFGLNDGLPLVYAGAEKDEQHIGLLAVAIKIHLIILSVITIAVMTFSIFFLKGEKSYIFSMLAINIIPTVVIYIFIGIFLSENKSILYNISNLFMRGITCVGIILLLALDLVEYRNLVFVSTFGTVIMMLVLGYMEKAYLLGEENDWREGVKEHKKLCIAGIKVMTSTVLMGLVPACGRIAIEYFGNIHEYGIYAFYISLLSVILAFSSAVGIVLFPILRNSKKENLTKNYQLASYLYIVVVGTAFFFFKLMCWLINKYMPEYLEGISYFSLLFMSCYPLGKIHMVITPYYKTYRMEDSLLRINFFIFIIELIMTIVVYLLFKKVYFVAWITAVFCMIYYWTMRCNLPSEFKNKDDVVDLYIPIAFVIMETLFNGIGYYVFYGFFYIGVCIYAYKKFKCN